MTTVTIPKEEYQELITLKERFNSLRELVTQPLKAAPDKGAEKAPSRLSMKQAVDKYHAKLNKKIIKKK